MAKTVTKQKQGHVYSEVWGGVFSLVTILTFLSLVNYDAGDLGFNLSHSNEQIGNAIGWIGAVWSFILFWCFGMAAHLVPFLFLVAAISFFVKKETAWGQAALWALLFLLTTSALLDLQHFFGEVWQRKIGIADSVGGFLGRWISLFLQKVAGVTGATILLSSLMLTALFFLYRLGPVELVARCWNWLADQIQEWQDSRLEKQGAVGQIEVAKRKLGREQKILEKTLAKQAAASVPRPTPVPQVMPIPALDEEEAPAVPLPPPRIIDAAVKAEVPPPVEPLPVAKKEEAKEVREPEEIEAVIPAKAPEVRERKPAPVSSSHAPANLSGLSAVGGYDDYLLPPLALLKKADVSRHVPTSEAELVANAELLVFTLSTFGIEVTRGDITKGATITRYEVYPAVGVRVDRIVTLQRDLARAMKAERINILAPIPGKDSVGIEIPNTSKVPIVLRDLFETPEWTSAKSRIPLALGKGVYGETLVADLAEMPHLLIAGTTGSGKSVCINSILLSLLYKFSPADLRLILVDPKQVEMQVYNDIPHLVVPVVVDPKKVLVALNWAVKEMEKRYKMLAMTGVRNIAAFNARPKDKEKAEIESKRKQDEPEQLDLLAGAEGGDADGVKLPAEIPKHLRPDPDDVIPEKLPYLVIIIDELADLMQTTGADVETAIVRLCQKARAAGIHLIVATQTPRREVITSLIKTNIPSRVAFQVPSSLDSRVILDENGAENLLGKGDMLYLAPGSGKTMRGQGAFVTDDEVKTVVEFTAKQAGARFEAEIHKKLNPQGATDEEIADEDKELIVDCLDVIREEKRASTSMLQRRLRLGYNRAAWVVDFLERHGILGPENGAKPREILVDLDQYDPGVLFGG
ncbi:DNA translocase FtsK [Verrucomicrobium sp. GAS474]|uniref:DNA translocase FtsK n=1 Tax=Verrucomicrobium sp. GAS474 TaxID=1882831 RepID=UPI00087A2260|nr:DNA translocase FtsK [Verrucomicrobium sp. GAS474]SDU25446.1 DNA translocase FtsK [Verrucomicrobium sp. GAS474]